MNLPGGRRSGDEGDDDYWPFGRGASPADAPDAAPAPPPQPPPGRPAGESVLPQVERRVSGDRRRSAPPRRRGRRSAGADDDEERRWSPGRRSTDVQQPAPAPHAVPGRSRARGTRSKPHVADAALLLLAVLVAVLVVLALTG